jgi:microcystin-dependent protein
MAIITPGYLWADGNTVTAALLNQSITAAVISGIVNADIAAGAAIDDSKLATIVSAGKVANSATTATSANTASTIVARDPSGNFSCNGITCNSISGSAQLFLVPTGAVLPFAMNAAPQGWLAADGSAVSRTTYASLFAAIGTQYGVGDGSTTFALPDLRGYFVRGSGTNVDGTASGTFATKQADDFKSHTHTATVTDPGHSHGTNAPMLINGSGLGGGSQTGTAAATVYASVTRITVSNSSTGGTETRPKNIAMLYSIKT